MSIFPDKTNFRIWKGATFRERIILYEIDSADTPQDLTGYTAELIIRDKPDGAALLTMTTENDGINLGTTNGVIELVIEAADTAALTWQRGVFDLTITGGSNGDTTAILYGGFSVSGV